MNLKPKVIVFMPAYNTASILPKTYRDLPKDKIDEIILVDDGSHDNTAEVAKKLGMIVIQHKQNRGYGGAQKTGYKEALKRGADIVVMVHSDHQYDPRLTNKFINLIAEGEADAVTGTRMTQKYKAMQVGMPWWKYYANCFLTKLENITFTTNLTDFHNGFRAYSRKVLESIPLDELSEKFDFDSDIIVQIVIRGFKIAEVPHIARYRQENSQMPFGKGVRYGLSILKLITEYKLHNWKIRRKKYFNISPDLK